MELREHRRHRKHRVWAETTAGESAATRNQDTGNQARDEANRSPDLRGTKEM